MKDRFYKLLSVICCVALIFSFGKIRSLENDIRNLKTYVSRVEHNVQQDVNSIYSNVDAQLEKQASLLNNTGFRVVSGDIRSKTAVIEIKLQPKEYTPGKTSATVKVNGENYPMTLTGDTYAAEITVSMLENTVVESVSFEENGTVRTEKLNWSTVPRYDYMTTVHGSFSMDTATGRAENGSYSITIDGIIEITAQRREIPTEITAVELIQVTGGKEIYREKLTETAEDSCLSAEKAKELEISRREGWRQDVFTYNLKQTFTVPLGSTTYLYADVTDKDGFVHRCILEMWKISSDGRDWDDGYGWYRGMEAAEVYNPDGTLLYKVNLDEEIY